MLTNYTFHYFTFFRSLHILSLSLLKLQSSHMKLINYQYSSICNAYHFSVCHKSHNSTNKIDVHNFKWSRIFILFQAHFETNQFELHRLALDGKHKTLKPNTVPNDRDRPRLNRGEPWPHRGAPWPHRGEP